MGCDGGTIPTRGELVRTKKKPEQVGSQIFVYHFQGQTYSIVSEMRGASAAESSAA